MADNDRVPIATETGWAEEIHRTLVEADVRQVCYVPDAGHTRLIERCLADQRMKSVCLTTEQEGVAMLGGAWLGGERGALLMQSSGVGNCINMLGMTHECRFPLLMLVTMRGEWGEFNPWQTAMGQGTRAALESVGVTVEHVDDASRVVETVDAAARFAFGSTRAVAVLIGQRVIGFKQFRN